MKPILFQSSQLTIYAYGCAALFAFLVCLFLALKVRPKAMTVIDIFQCCLLVLLGCLFGGRLLPAISNLGLSSGLSQVLKFWEPAPFSFVSGMGSSLILAMSYLKLRGLSVLNVCDFAVPIGVLGITLQRGLGCLAAGCCYGQPSPFGFIFAPNSRAGLLFPETALHPTQLYYAIATLILFVALKYWQKQPLPTGGLALLGMGFLTWSYALITYFRGDTAFTMLMHTQTRSQMLATLLSLTCFTLFLWQFARHRLTGDRPCPSH